MGFTASSTVREVIETAREITGHPIPSVDAPRRPGDPPELVAGSEKIRQELGWPSRREVDVRQARRSRA